MSDPAPAAAEPKDFRSILKALLGKKLTVVNPESYEAAPVGFRIKEGFYEAKLIGLGTDFLTLATVFESAKKGGGTQPVKQFIPIARIKRISLMKEAFVVHL